MSNETSAGSSDFRRTITAVLRCSDGADVTLDCGHVARCNQIYSYRVGDTKRCYVCEHGDTPFPWEPLRGTVMEQLP